MDEMEGKCGGNGMYNRWKKPPRKRKNRWDVITENKLEAMNRIMDEAP
jgi:hypothetical protein